MKPEVKKHSVKKNYIYNLIYQIFTMIVPIITTPYISQVLLPEGVGKYSYTYSIVSYFVLFAQLGFGYYAQREVAKYQGDKYRQTVIFYEVLIVKLITVSLSISVYIVLCFGNVFKEYTVLMWWWIFLILAQGVDIGFLYQGNEDFAKVVVRNFFIKLLGIAMIFVLVKRIEDVWIYVLSVSLSNFLGALSTWVYLPKFLCKINRRDIHPIHHIKPTIKLFIPTIATAIYSYLDKTLIGTLIKDTYVDSLGEIKKYSDIENGFYEQSEKIIKVGISVLTALGSVMLPRNAKEFADGNRVGLKNNIYSACRFVFFIGCPIMFGVIAIANNLIPWFLGSNFEKSITYLIMFSPLVILLGLDNVFGIQYLLTTRRENKYSIAVISGCIVNIVFNVLLIPLLWGKGAIFASVLSQVVIVGIMYYYIRKEISIRKILLDSKNYLISAIIMFLVVFIIQLRLNASMINTIILISIGAVIYFVFLIIFKDQMFFSVFNIVINKIKKVFIKKNANS